jgi:teichuronic acid biosynthesis glycosyltransferase TuaG
MNGYTGISVIIPAFDRKELLLRAIGSVDSDDPERTEIVVVDDCSPNLDLADLPSRNVHGIAVRTFRLTRNGGPQAARNYGIRRARFSHIALLDSDETFHPGKLAAVRQVIDRNDPDIVFHAETGVPGYNAIARRWWRQGRPVVPFHWLIALLNPVGTSSLVFVRNGRLGAPSLRFTEDWAFLLRYVTPQTRVVYLTSEWSQVHRTRGSEGGESAARWRMRKGEFQARTLLLRHGAPSDLVRFAIGSAMGSLRLANDLLRTRYWTRRSRD